MSSARTLPRSAASCMCPDRPARDQRQWLVDVCGWLVVQAMFTERVQYNQLCAQSLENVWRSNAFDQLLHLYLGAEARALQPDR